MNLQANIFKLPILLIALLYFSSCEKDDIQARESIRGNWTVVEITSLYASFTANGFGTPTATVSEQGQLGTFNFEEDVVDFSFTRNDTLFAGNSTWNLSTERVNAGFTQVTEFTLAIENEFVFDLTFEDATLNSEKDAREVTFTNSPNNGIGVLIVIKLEKN
jgi:hypothetical protein